MMTVKEVAQILLNRQNSAYSFILDGATRTKLTPDGFEYARGRGWIELDESTSCMRVSMRAVKLDEIKAAAAAESSISIEAALVASKSSGHELALNHVQETTRRYSADTVVAESTVPETSVVKHEDSWRKFMPFESQSCPGIRIEEYNPAPPAAAPTGNPQAQQLAVGDSVQIAEDGTTYQATVQAMHPDGSYVLSFGQNRPSKIKPSYAKEEVAKVDGGKPQQGTQPSKPTPSQPAEPAPTMTAGPAAPGVGHK